MPAHAQVQQERAVQQRRAARLSRLQGDGRGGAAWLWGLLRRSWARAGYAVADHSRSALILAVFAFKARLGRGVVVVGNFSVGGRLHAAPGACSAPGPDVCALASGGQT